MPERLTSMGCKLLRRSVNSGSVVLTMMVLLPVLYSCQPPASSRADETNALIDSLIRIHRINERAIVAVFGAECISAINTREGIVVIDAGISTGLTEKIRKRIEHEFDCSTFVYVINTHTHPDHYGGNGAFPESRIIGQVNGLKEMDERLADSAEVLISLEDITDEYELELQSSQEQSEEWIRAFTQKTRYESAYNDLKNRVPVKKTDITFSDSLTIAVGDLTFEMMYFGKCHSGSDILICVPELRLLFSGDLISEYGRPSLNDSTLSEREQWIKAVRWAEERLPDIDQVIAGHGQILSADDLASFIRMIREKVNNDS